ncbi:MAG: hypothetical protein L6V95_03880 [Candidatus Melainabacteria bacterium]|nr:MAG: hypothetical protein L6V95_03880 [Candidatus Melainabacteria bacterium]
MDNIEKLFFLTNNIILNTYWAWTKQEEVGGGDVFAACVCFDLENVELAQYLKKLNDSKKAFFKYQRRTL